MARTSWASADFDAEANSRTSKRRCAGDRRPRRNCRDNTLCPPLQQGRNNKQQTAMSRWGERDVKKMGKLRRQPQGSPTQSSWTAAAAKFADFSSGLRPAAENEVDPSRRNGASIRHSNETPHPQPLSPYLMGEGRIC